MAYDKYDDLWDWEKKPRMEGEKEEIIHVQNKINLQNNLEINTTSIQIILGLLSPFIISFSLLILFPPCFFWCSSESGGFGSMLICSHSLLIFLGFAYSAHKFSFAFIISAIPSFLLAFYFWSLMWYWSFTALSLSTLSRVNLCAKVMVHFRRFPPILSSVFSGIWCSHANSLTILQPFSEPS